MRLLPLAALLAACASEPRGPGTAPASPPVPGPIQLSPPVCAPHHPTAAPLALAERSRSQNAAVALAARDLFVAEWRAMTAAERRAFMDASRRLRR